MTESTPSNQGTDAEAFGEAGHKLHAALMVYGGASGLNTQDFASALLTVAAWFLLATFGLEDARTMLRELTERLPTLGNPKH